MTKYSVKIKLNDCGEKPIRRTIKTIIDADVRASYWRDVAVPLINRLNISPAAIERLTIRTQKGFFGRKVYEYVPSR